MKGPDVQTSPSVYARVAGWLYLFIIVVGFFDEMFVRGRIIVPGDALATARNMAASESLWRLGFAGEITMWVFAVAVLTILYLLLRPVNAGVALLALLFGLLDTGIETLNATLCNFAALFFSSGSGSLKAFDQGQLAALASLALRLHEYGFGAGLLFFGISLMLLGYLIAGAGYLPKWLGVLAAIGGICYTLNSYAVFVAPSLADAIFPAILLPALIAELSIALWLIVMGVDVTKWKEQAVPHEVVAAMGRMAQDNAENAKHY